MLPNKVVSFNESAFPGFIFIKKILLNYESIDVEALWQQCERQIEDVADFIQILESLYALKQITFIDGEVMLNVEKNNL